ncbi:O-antigen ligase family protein [Arthrobacter mangrovi]|uniref:O-antigen ligase family protein n=1 Tax=Arthrobacter mangrovi TaxID=2966350 RepID=UPI00222EA50C|nr:hypothetical protein [Arthrobacter mangrovi]
MSTVGVTSRLGPLSISEIFFSCAILSSLLFNARRIPTYRPGKVELGILFFVLTTLVLELINSLALGHEPAFYLTYNWTIYLFAVFAARLCLASRGELRSFLGGFVLLVPLAAVIALMQLLDNPTISRTILELAPNAGAMARLEEGAPPRASGLIGHWTGLGSYLVAMAVAVLALTLMSASRSNYRMIALGVIGLGVLSTFTFSVIITYILVVAVYFIKTKRGLILLLLSGIFGFVASAFLADSLAFRVFQQYGDNAGAFSSSSGLIPETVMFRFSIWINETLPAVLERPVTGWGQGVYIQFGQWTHFPEDLLWRSPESQWFSVLMQGGLLLLVVIGYVIVQLWRAASMQESQLAVVLKTFLLLCVATAFTVPQFTNAGLPAVLFVLFGALERVARSRRS